MERHNLYGVILSSFFVCILLVSCGSGSGGSAEGTVTVQGNVSSENSGGSAINNSSFQDKLKALLSFTQDAYAQQILAGIQVQAFENGNLVAQDNTNANGEFTLVDVPCNQPLTLVFTHQGNSVTLQGVTAPCVPGQETGVIGMLVTLNFGEESGDVEIVDSIENALISCTSGTEIIEEDEFFLDGEGGPCIITAGNCTLDISSSVVIMTGCRTCIDTRGTSSVIVNASQFECVADRDGIRAVGNSLVDMLVVPEDAEEENGNNDNNENDLNNGNILVISGEDGVDARGNSGVVLAAPGNGIDSGFIDIEGVTEGVIARGNSSVEINGVSCTVEPSVTEIGNASVVVACVE